MYEDEQNYINSEKIENISLNTISLNIFLKKYFFVFFNSLKSRYINAYNKLVKKG